MLIMNQTQFNSFPGIQINGSSAKYSGISLKKSKSFLTQNIQNAEAETRKYLQANKLAFLVNESDRIISIWHEVQA